MNKPSLYIVIEPLERTAYGKGSIVYKTLYNKQRYIGLLKIQNKHWTTYNIEDSNAYDQDLFSWQLIEHPSKLLQRLYSDE